MQKSPKLYTALGLFHVVKIVALSGRITAPRYARNDPLLVYTTPLPLRTGLLGCISAKLPSAFSAISSMPWL